MKVGRVLKSDVQDTPESPKQLKTGWICNEQTQFKRICGNAFFK